MHFNSIYTYKNIKHSNGKCEWMVVLSLCNFKFCFLLAFSVIIQALFKKKTFSFFIQMQIKILQTVW